MDEGCEVGPPARVFVEPLPDLSATGPSAPASPLDAALDVCKCICGEPWHHGFSHVNPPPAESDPNPFPKFRLFRRSK